MSGEEFKCTLKVKPSPYLSLEADYNDPCGMNEKADHLSRDVKCLDQLLTFSDRNLRLPLALQT